MGSGVCGSGAARDRSSSFCACTGILLYGLSLIVDVVFLRVFHFGLTQSRSVFPIPSAPRVVSLWAVGVRHR